MYEYAATVVKVVDGDTVDLRIDLGLRVHTETRCRLLGLNAPEHNTSEGQMALKFLTSTLPVGTKVVVRTQKDKTEKYGRWLVQIQHDDTDINALLIRRGHAKAWDGKGTRPT